MATVGRVANQWVVRLLAPCLAAAAGIAAFPTSSSAVAEPLPPPVNGVWSVVGNGHGHGPGLSQSGARAAARRGPHAAPILALHHPRPSPAIKSASVPGGWPA